MSAHGLDAGELVFLLLFRTDRPLRLFGAWDALDGSSETAIPEAPPVGTPCFICSVDIQENDQGELLERRDNGAIVPVHVDCMGLLLYGHDVKLCPCTGFAGIPRLPDGGPNLRLAGLEVARRKQAQLVSELVAERRAAEKPS